MPVIIRQRARVRGTANQGKGRGISPANLERLKADLETYGQQSVDNFRRFIRTWRGERPTFIYTVEDTETGVRMRVTLTGSSYGKLKYRWVSGGTRVRYATMSDDWESKTIPEVLDSQPGSGKLAFVDKRLPNPGIASRQAELLVRDEIEYPFIQMVRAKYRMTASIRIKSGVKREDYEGG